MDPGVSERPAGLAGFEAPSCNSLECGRNLPLDITLSLDALFQVSTLLNPPRVPAVTLLQEVLTGYYRTAYLSCHFLSVLSKEPVLGLSLRRCTFLDFDGFACALCHSKESCDFFYAMTRKNMRMCLPFRCFLHDMSVLLIPTILYVMAPMLHFCKEPVCYWLTLR